MVEKTYYINNSIELEEAVDFIQDSFPCLVEREFIEMDYSKITINARAEDAEAINSKLAPLV